MIKAVNTAGRDYWIGEYSEDNAIDFLHTNFVTIYPNGDSPNAVIGSTATVNLGVRLIPVENVERVPDNSYTVNNFLESPEGPIEVTFQYPVSYNRAVVKKWYSTSNIEEIGMTYFAPAWYPSAGIGTRAPRYTYVAKSIEIDGDVATLNGFKVLMSASKFYYTATLYSSNGQSTHHILSAIDSLTSDSYMQILTEASYSDISSVELTYVGEYFGLVTSFNSPIEYPQDVNIEIYFTKSSPYEPEGNSGPGGGGGNFGQDETSDNVTSDLPSGSTEASLGAYSLYTRFIPNVTELVEFADWFFPNTIKEEFNMEIAQLLFGDVSQALISLQTYPFAIDKLDGVDAQPGYISFPGSSCYTPSQVLNSNYATIDWGTIEISEYWGNFLDYAPHTKIELFLPWCTGTVPIDPNEVMNSTISVITNIELDQGTCLHNVLTGKGAVIGTYSGVCGRGLPLTSRDTNGKLLTLTTAAVAGIVAGAVGIGVAGVASESAGMAYTATQPLKMNLHGAAKTSHYAKYMRGLEAAEAKAARPYQSFGKKAAKLASTTATVASRIPPTIARNGSFNGTSAGLGIQYPYLVISRPEQSVPEQYGAHYGYPSNIYSSLRYLSGYTEVGEIHLKNIPATAEELSELETILKGGVIL